MAHEMKGGRDVQNNSFVYREYKRYNIFKSRECSANNERKKKASLRFRSYTNFVVFAASLSVHITIKPKGENLDDDYNDDDDEMTIVLSKIYLDSLSATHRSFSFYAFQLDFAKSCLLLSLVFVVFL